MPHDIPSEDPAPTWNSVPEITASGSPWDIGFTHGSKIPNRIRGAILNYARLFLETAGVDWEESKARAAKFLPALERNEQDIVEEMRGIAAGAGVNFLDILALNVRSEIALTNYSDGCTSIATQDVVNGVIFVAQNWDWVSEASASTVLFDIRKDSEPHIKMMGEAGIVAKFGLNEYGVGICMNAIRCGAVNQDALPVHIAMRRVLECKSFDKAFEMLQKKGVASCFNLVIGDRSGKVATIECTPKGLAPIFPQPGSSTTWHTNHLWSPDVPEGIKDHPSANSFSRLERIKELTEGQTADSQKIRAWLSDEKGTPVSICRSVPPNTKGIERMETLATVILDLYSLKAEISFGKPSLIPPVRLLTME